MKKLAGTDLIVLLNAAAKSDAVLKEAQALKQSDFNNDDLIVNCFLNIYPDGFRSAGIKDKTKLESAINALSRIKKEVSNQGLRKAHNYLQNIRQASNEAVQLENALSDFRHESEFELQFKSAKLLNFLSKYTDGQKNREALASAVKDINEGKLDEASSTIQTVFARINPEQNIKTAFVTIKQQIGEGYLMCPKAIYQTGHPVPMAVSNCRDYCIDARKQPDGTVSCNYLKWLNENLITQEQALNLFDKMDYGQDGVEFMNLEKGERTHFPMSDQDSQDMRMVRDEKITEEVTMKPWEEQLDAVRENKNTKSKPKTSTIASESAIEKILQQTREVFDEEDLDNLEAQIRAFVGE